MNPPLLQTQPTFRLCFLSERITIENSLEIGSHEKITKNNSLKRAELTTSQKGVMGDITDTYSTVTSHNIQSLIKSKRGKGHANVNAYYRETSSTLKWKV
jgi:hypothetical protein